MTTLERRCLETFRELLAHFGRRHMERKAFMYIIGQVRDRVSQLENEMFGCPTGTHKDYCLCTPAVQGKNIRWIKANAKRLKK